MVTSAGAYEDDTYVSKIKLALAAANYPNYFVKDKDAIHEETCIQMFGNNPATDTVMFTGMSSGPLWGQILLILEMKGQLKGPIFTVLDSSPGCLQGWRWM